MILGNFTSFVDPALLILRLVVAVIFIYHALPKLKNSQGMAKMVAMPAGMVLMLGMMELLAAMALILGVWSQLAALVLAVIMIGALGMKIMKWHVPFGAMDKTGWEFDLILLAASLVIIVTDGGQINVF